MYINFWYPMARIEELTDKPMKVGALGQDFVLFRDDNGDAACISNTCTHRGGSLSGGKIKGNCIECPYHGWQFDADGNVHRIPSLGKNARIPGRTRIDAYPVEEKFGLIFAFLGDLAEDQRPPVIDVAEWAQDGWRATIQDYTLRANYERSVENGIDPAHNEFVHDTHGFEGEDEEYKVDEMRIVEPSGWGKGFWHDFTAPSLTDDNQMKDARPDSGKLEVGTGFHGPNQVWTYIHLSDEVWIHQYLVERPIDDSSTHIYLVCMRNSFLEPAMDQNVIDRNQYVADQDVKIIENLNPALTPPTNTKEFMTPSDKCILMYREALNRWDANGWRIDTDTVEQNMRKVAYAVPSPARCHQKGWVLDSIPLVDAEQATKPKLKATG
jgi:phenylpropionate dioxygenase-like ring-hydroxylating dioxygenase large terminal subunit